MADSARQWGGQWMFTTDWVVVNIHSDGSKSKPSEWMDLAWTSRLTTSCRSRCCDCLRLVQLRCQGQPGPEPGLSLCE